jgi:hypothetical protein
LVRLSRHPKKIKKATTTTISENITANISLRAWLGVDQLRQARAVESDGTPVCTTHDKRLGVGSQTKAAGSGVDINRQF